MVSSTDWTREIVLAAEPMSAWKARDFTCLHLAAHGLQHLADDVCVVVSELATNAVTHAGTRFTLTLSAVAGSLRVSIADRGRSAPTKLSPVKLAPAEFAPAEFAPGDLDVNGRGLLLVESLSRDWGTTTNGSGGKTVWASFVMARP